MRLADLKNSVKVNMGGGYPFLRNLQSFFFHSETILA